MCYNVVVKSQLKNPNTPDKWDNLLFYEDWTYKDSPFYRDKIQRISKFLKGKKGNLLDLGFGAAHLEYKLLKDGTNLKFYGVDFSQKAVSNAKKNIKGYFVKSEIYNLPFKDSKFDFIVILDVLEHIPEDKSKMVFNEISRVIKRNGCLIVSVPLNENLKKMNEDGTNYNMHLREYTYSVLEKELQNIGFKISKSDYIYSFEKYYYLKKIISKILIYRWQPNLLIIFSQKE